MWLRHTRWVVALALLALPPQVTLLEAEESGELPTLLFKLQDRHAAFLALREVRASLEQDDLDRALRAAQDVLDDMPEDLFVVATESGSVRWRLAAEEVRDLLAALAPSERRRYAQLTRPVAAPLLERARRAHDRQGLVEVVRRFGASDVGRDAARLLSGIELEDGDLRSAAWWAREGLRFEPADPVLWSHVVDALGLAGDRAALEALGLSEGGPSSGPQPARRRAAWLARLPVPPAPAGWPQWGGAAERDRPAPSAGPRPQTLRWRAPIPLPLRSLDREPMSGWVQDDSRSFMAWWARFCPFHPAADADAVYVANGRSVVAYDLYSDRRLWAFEEGATPSLDLIAPERMGQGRTSFERAFAPALWDDLVIATVEVEVPYRPEHLNLVEISTYLPRRVLVGLDRQTGSLRWWMSQQSSVVRSTEETRRGSASGGLSDADDAEALHDLTIVSPCVVDEGLVVAAADRNLGSLHHVGVVALDARTGRLAWYRELGVGQQELNLFGSSVKELAAAAPASAGGVVYVTSGLGFVAALSLRTGRPLWVASYEIQPIQPVQYWFRAPLRFPLVAPSPVVVHDDLVLVAPTDGLHLSAFERSTGRLRWRVPYPRLPDLGATVHFLGTTNDGRRDVALLAGGRLEAYDLADGRLVWYGRLQEEFGERNVPTGRGVVAGDLVLLPTDDGLVRFNVRREGAFEGRDPWPDDVQPGNLLPLPQVLLVAGGDALQGFYSWEEIARDVALRRTQRPDDPFVLLEAGDVYRTGGAEARALEAFTEALELSRRRGDRVAERRAEQGLFRTWLDLGDQQVATDPHAAREALERALAWARSAVERVAVRVRLDAVLSADLEARITNLQRLAEEGPGVLARFQGYRGEVSARAIALLRLAQAQVDAGAPDLAVAALQRLLREDPDALIDGVPARQLARRTIDEILRVWGREAYATFEAEARQLLEVAQRDEDPELLDRILATFPNASVVPEALFQLGRHRWEEGRVALATSALQDLLRDHAASPWAGSGAALLSRAYQRLGLEGAHQYALAWLVARMGDETIEVDGTPLPARAYVARATSERVEVRAPPPRPFAFPLREARFEQASEGAWGSQVDVSAPPGQRSPLALFRDGLRLVAFDLPGCRVAFDVQPGSCHRAAWDAGTLVLALPDSLEALDGTDGASRWRYDVEGTVTELVAAHGQVFALVQDTTSRRGGMRTLIALDLARGEEVWRLELDRHEYRDLLVTETDLVLRQSRAHANQILSAVQVYDGLTGSLRGVLDLPVTGIDEGPVLAGRRLVYVGREAQDRYRMTGLDLDGVRPTWSRVLPGRAACGALLVHGDEVLALQEDGYLSSCLAVDGTPRTQTKILVGGAGARARPYYFTQAVLSPERLVMMPLGGTGVHHVVAWSLDSGKVAWDLPWPEEERPSRADIARDGDVVLALASWTRQRDTARVVLRLIDLETGKLRQEIEPVGLAAEQGFLSLAYGWGTVVVFGRAGASVYGSP